MTTFINPAALYTYYRNCGKTEAEATAQMPPFNFAQPVIAIESWRHGYHVVEQGGCRMMVPSSVLRDSAA